MSSRNRGHRNPRRARPNPNFEANWDKRIDDFEEMGLKNELVHGIYSYGFKLPSDIQSLAIEPIVAGKDIIAQAQSGTGKTGAFGIGILNRINEELRKTQAIVLSPTRELATQTYDFMKSIATKMENFTIELFTGGHDSQSDQLKAQLGPMVAVCTPGRALDLINGGYLRCEDLKIVCMDEADEMLSEDFLDQVKDIFEYFPQDIQILLFSATVPPEIFSIMEGLMKDPVKILVKAEKLTLEGIRQFFVNVGQESNKMATLADIFGRITIQKAVIFANTKDAVQYIQQELEKQGFMVSAIHSGLTQQERDSIMKEFRVGAKRILIGTDLIARGIEVQQVTLVINFELPSDRESYLHRIGRSGRYGRKGVSINIICNKEVKNLEGLERFYQTNVDPLPEAIGDILRETNSQFDPPEN